MQLPVTTVQPGDPGLPPAFYIVSWMVLSNVTIIFNKYLLDTAGFPITLTALHLLTATAFTRVLARFTTLIPRPSIPITGRLYLRTILPIGLLYTLSLMCANLVYVYLSVPFIQMLKALAPVTTLLMSWMASLSDPKVSTLGNVLIIAFGVFLASVGETKFVWAGFLVHMLGTVAESGRLLLIQSLLRGPQSPGKEIDEEEAVSRRGIAGMNPLVGLYYFAPVCAILNGIVAFAVELRTFQAADLYRVGFGMLGLNCVVAFMLNVSGVFLIGKTSALAMNLTGILKSIILVVASLFIWTTPITFTQVVGWGIALVGMFYYSLPPEGMAPHVKVLEAWVGHVSVPALGPSTREDILRKAQELLQRGTGYVRAAGDLIGVDLVRISPGGEVIERGRPGRDEEDKMAGSGEGSTEEIANDKAEGRQD